MSKIEDLKFNIRYIVNVCLEIFCHMITKGE